MSSSKLLIKAPAATAHREAMLSTEAHHGGMLAFPGCSKRSSVRCSYGHSERRGPRSRLAVRSAFSQEASSGEVYKGMFGEWSVDATDVTEVTRYRAGLSVAAAALVVDTALALLPLGPDQREALRLVENAVALTGAAGLGVSLALIHIYVAPMKRALQGLYGVGALGGLFLMATQAESLPAYVANHPPAVWLVGPFFAAVTGLAFKEGVCYRKAEAGLLCALTPALLLGHLSGAVSGGVERGLLLAFVALCSVFAARKYTQPVKDDIGDKSVFEFLALPEAERERKMAELERQKQGMAGE